MRNSFLFKVALYLHSRPSRILHSPLYCLFSRVHYERGSVRTTKEPLPVLAASGSDKAWPTELLSYAYVHAEVVPHARGSPVLRSESFLALLSPPM